jgi:hypothetical protein
LVVKSLAVLAMVVYSASAAVNYPTFDYHGETETDNQWVVQAVNNPMVQAAAVVAAVLTKTVPLTTMEVGL